MNKAFKTKHLSKKIKPNTPFVGGGNIYFKETGGELKHMGCVDDFSFKVNE